jgi:hypothetical protein
MLPPLTTARRSAAHDEGAAGVTRAEKLANASDWVSRDAPPRAILSDNTCSLRCRRRVTGAPAVQGLKLFKVFS